MKKFLSVLLALAVAFTFTFGSSISAFAADNTEAQYLANLNTAKTNVIAVQKAEYDKAVISVNTTGDVKDSGNVYGVISKANWLAQLDVEYAAIVADINAKAATLETTAEYGNHKNDSVAELSDVIKGLAPTVIEAEILEALYASDGEYAAAAAKAQFPADKAAAIANAKSVDTSVFSTTKLDAPITFNNKTYDTNKDYADAIIAKVVADITAVELTDEDKTTAQIGSKIKGVSNSVKAAFDAYITKDADGKYIIDEDEAKAGDILSKTEEDAYNANKAATVAAKKATIASNIAGAYSAIATLSADQIAAYTALKNAYEAVETALVEKDPSHTVGAFPTYTTNTPAGNQYSIVKNTTTNVYDAVEGSTKYQAIVKAIADNAALAATIKGMKDADGNVAYDATKVDEIVAGKTADYYEDGVTIAPTPLVLDDFNAAKLYYYTAFEKSVLKENLATLVKADVMTIKSNGDEITVDNKTVVGAKALADADAEFYAKEWAMVEAIVATCNAAIDAATTTAEAEKAIADAKAEIAKVDTKSVVSAAYEVSGSDLNKALVAMQKEAAKYVANANYGITDQNKQITYGEAAVKAFLMENGARTSDEVTALKDKLLADIAATKTPEQVAAADKAAADAVIAMVKALPTQLNITLANEAAILAADKAYSELTDAAKRMAADATNGGIANIANDIAIAKGTVKGLREAAITAAIEAITKPVDGTKVTLEQKDAVKAVVADVDAYKTNYELSVTSYDDFVAAATATIKNLELKAIKDAIKALPTEITPADKATVEAIRAAIDAYVAEYTDVKAGINAADDITDAEYVLLATAEASAKYTNVNAKADLLDMSRKLTIWRTSKTSIKVTAVGSVKNIKDNGYTVKYSFYKKAPGATSYKLVKTTTSNKYTYTNLKKGTNKFQVKVKVYDADGKLVATKMTYYRAAKVK